MAAESFIDKKRDLFVRVLSYGVPLVRDMFLSRKVDDKLMISLTRISNGTSLLLQPPVLA